MSDDVWCDDGGMCEDDGGGVEGGIEEVWIGCDGVEGGVCGVIGGSDGGGGRRGGG